MLGGASPIDIILNLLGTVGPFLLWPLSGYIIAVWLRRKGRFGANLPDDAWERMETTGLADGGGGIGSGAPFFYTCLPFFAGPLLLLVWLLPDRR